MAVRGRKDGQGDRQMRLVCDPPFQAGHPEQLPLTYKLLSYPITQ